MRKSWMTNEQRKLLESIKDALKSVSDEEPSAWGYKDFSDEYYEDLYDWELVQFVKSGYGD